MMKSVIFASLEYGMTTAFISPELKNIQGAIKERYLQLTVSDVDEEGYLLDFYLGYYVFGKITRFAEGNEFESRSTAVYHLYFMDKDDFRNLQRKMEKGFFPVFISRKEDGFYRAEKLTFDACSLGVEDKEEKESLMLQELAYIKVLEYLQENRSVRIKNLLFENRSVIYFLITRFDLSLLSKVDIRIGCKKSYYSMSYEDDERHCLCICKDDENATTSLLDIFEKPIKAPYMHLLDLKQYYKLSSDHRYYLEKTLEDFVEEKKKQSFETCASSCLNYIMIMKEHIEQYQESCENKRRRKRVHARVKRAHKILMKMQKLLANVMKEEAILRVGDKV